MNKYLVSVSEQRRGWGKRHTQHTISHHMEYLSIFAKEIFQVSSFCVGRESANPQVSSWTSTATTNTACTSWNKFCKTAKKLRKQKGIINIELNCCWKEKLSLLPLSNCLSGYLSWKDFYIKKIYAIRFNSFTHVLRPTAWLTHTQKTELENHTILCLKHALHLI